jgi:endonuclease YncB( thermonuclease family)
MAGQHCGERDGKSSRIENALIGIFSTVAALGFYGGLALAAVALRHDVSDGDGVTRTIRISCIDAPESGQPFGADAQAPTMAVVLNCTVQRAPLTTTCTDERYVLRCVRARRESER